MQCVIVTIRKNHSLPPPGSIHQLFSSTRSAFMHADTGDGHLAVCVDCAEAQGEMGIRFYTKLMMAITTAKRWISKETGP